MPSTRPATIAHRGASGYAPEHTFAAYDIALELEADFIELDLQQTADEALVVLHDDTMDRTCRGLTGPVRNHTLTAIRECDAGTWFNERFPDRARREFVGLRVPSLDDVFRRYGTGADYYIETKSPEYAPGMEQALVRSIHAHGLQGAGPEYLRPPTGTRAPAGRVVVQSFSEQSLRRVRKLDPSLPVVLLTEAGWSPERARAALPRISEFADGIGPERGTVNRDLIESAHALGLVVHPYTVDAPEELHTLAELGVDAVFTNFPDRLTGVRPTRVGPT